MPFCSARGPRACWPSNRSGGASRSALAWWQWTCRGSGGMVKDIIEAPDLDEFRRADPRQLVNTALSGISRYTLPESVRDDYLASYQGDRFAESVRYLRSYPAELPLLTGHFTWEDAKTEYADLVTDWWRGAANA
jgi:hypothetical protein